MEIPVLVEPIAGGKPRFRAKSGEPWLVSAEGDTADEAVSHVQSMVRARLAAGARMMMVPIDESSNPWLEMAGIFADDDLTKDWIKSMQEYRDEVNRREAIS